jgi:RNA polymerase-binding transcription factor DksA
MKVAILFGWRRIKAVAGIPSLLKANINMFGWNLKSKLQKLMEQKNYTEAAVVASKMLRDSPGNMGVRRLRAGFYVEMKEYQSALKDIYLGLSEDPEDPDWVILLAYVYRDMGHPDAAVAIVGSVVKANPTFSRLYNYAIMLEAVKRYDDAMVIYQRLGNEWFPDSADDSEGYEICRLGVTMRLAFGFDTERMRDTESALAPEIRNAYNSMAENGMLSKLVNPEVLAISPSEGNLSFHIIANTVDGYFEGEARKTEPKWIFDLESESDKKHVTKAVEKPSLNATDWIATQHESLLTHKSSLEKSEETNSRIIALFDIDRALKKIEDGAYGSCELCGKPIPRSRLKVLPSTRYHVKCQSELAACWAQGRNAPPEIG